VKRIAWLALAVLLLLTWATAPAAAQDDPDLKMQVEIGLDGYCRAESWCPIRVILSNEGADVEGELVMPIEVASGSETRSEVYSRQVVLPAHSRKAYFLHAPPARTTSHTRLGVELRYGAEQPLRTQSPVTWLDEGERLYGIISSDSSAFGFLAKVRPLGGSASVAYLDLEALPPDPLAWESLDVLVLNDVDTTALTEDQHRALEMWVAHGGHLIVGGGAGAARTAAGVADLLPVTIGGTRSVETLYALGGYTGVVPATGPYAVADTTLQDGVVLIEQDGLVLMARRSYGAGHVDMLAFDAGLNPFADIADLARLWDWVVGAGTRNAQRFAVRDGYAAYEAANLVPGRGLPSTLHILGFLLVYILLVGPVNYIVLRKLDRRELAWLTIPILIIGFSGCAYVTGFQLRGYSAIVHRLAMVYVPGEADVGRSYQLVGLFSPRRTNYDVWVPDAKARGIPFDYYYGAPLQQSLSLREEAGGVTIDNVRVDVGGIEPFMAEGYRELSPIEIDLRLVTKGGLWLEGTIRNGGVALKDALVLVGTSEQRLGDIEPSQEVNIRVPFHGATSPGGYMPGLPEQILGTSSYYDDPDLHRRYMFLQALFAPYVYSYGATAPSTPVVLEAGAYLIGWNEDDAPLSIEVRGHPYFTEDTTLYVYALPLQNLVTDAEVTIPSGLVEREVVKTEGQVEVRPEGFYMAPDSAVTFRFSWSAIPLQQIDALELDVRCEGCYGSPPAPPGVSLWNRETGEWDRQEVEWGKNRIAGVDPYVVSSGSVLVRMEAGDGMIETGSLSISVEGK
jgi:hypothetical protein